MAAKSCFKTMGSTLQLNNHIHEYARFNSETNPPTRKYCLRILRTKMRPDVGRGHKCDLKTISEVPFC